MCKTSQNCVVRRALSWEVLKFLKAFFNEAGFGPALRANGTVLGGRLLVASRGNKHTQIARCRLTRGRDHNSICNSRLWRADSSNSLEEFAKASNLHLECRDKL